MASPLASPDVEAATAVNSVARARTATVTVFFFAGIGLLLFSLSMGKLLNHDEHMYVGGAALLAQEGALPYRDFPYFQMPGLVFAYAPLLLITDNLLLVARTFSTLCGLGLLGVLFYAAYDRFSAWPVSLRWPVAAAAVAFVVANPVFLYTSGLAWNHDLALLAAFSGFVLYMRGVGGDVPSRRALFAAGVLVTFAAATRLTYALVLVPLALSLCFYPHHLATRARLRAFVAFGGGVLLVVVAALVVFGIAPERALFDNVGYHNLNVQYWQAQGYTRAMDLSGKLAYAVDMLEEPGTLLLLATYALLTVWAVLLQRRYVLLSPEIPLTFVVLLTILAGVLVPTPTWYQYFFPLVPFLALGCVYALAAVVASSGQRSPLVLWPMLATLAFLLGVPSFSARAPLLSPETWVPTRLRATADEIRGYAQGGRVLTLAPLYALEAGLRVYEPFVASPFAWRSAQLLSAVDRTRLDMIAPEDLATYISPRRPDMILTGYEPTLEGALVEYAEGHNYRRNELKDGAVLWLAP